MVIYMPSGEVVYQMQFDDRAVTVQGGFTQGQCYDSVALCNGEGGIYG